jgi:uncharacterized protein (DUF2141 family)
MVMRRRNEMKLFARAALAATVFTSSVAVADEPAPSSPPRATATVAVNVGNFRNTNGMLGCRLYSARAGFPESPKGTVERRVSIRGLNAQCSFEGVPPGTYAVSVMHDENDNQRLDKNFLGIPTEGYGVSNNHTYAMSSPTWEESKFVVEPGKNLGLGILLRY